MTYFEPLLHILTDYPLFAWLIGLISFALGFGAGWSAAWKHYKIEEMKKQLSELDFAHPIVNDDGYIVDEAGKELCPHCWKKKMKVRLAGLPLFCPMCGWIPGKKERCTL